MRVFRRGNSWYVDYVVDGNRYRKSFGKQKAMAELFIKDIELKKAKGELRLIDDSILLREFLERYSSYSKVSKANSTFKTDLSRSRVLFQYLESVGVRKLRDVTSLRIEGFKVKILQEAGPTTFNRYLQLAKAMLNKAVEWEMLTNNPLSKFKQLKNPSQRQVRFFGQSELRRILEGSIGILHSFIEVLVMTGMRRSELINLKWVDIDLQNMLITVQANIDNGFHPKGYRPRTIPVSKELEKVLLDLPSNGTYVFDNGENHPAHCADYYTKEFDKLLKRLGIANASLHTLRHTFASHLVMRGVDIRTVQELLGHSTVIVTERYSHLSPVHRLKAVELITFEDSEGAKKAQYENGHKSPN